jgi:DNA-binding NtrC family response regulator
VNGNSEDSPSVVEPSNRTTRIQRTALREACRVVGSTRPDSSKLERLLELALVACDAERAFVVRGAGRTDGEIDPVVEACRLRRADGRDRLSRTVARGVLEHMRAFVSIDLRADQRIERGASVRALQLRRVLAAPLPAAQPGPRALVLDSRVVALPETVDDAIETVEAFAGLIGLVGPRVGVPVPSKPEAGAARGDIVGRSSAMVAALAWARRVARSNLPVLVQGETGSGKEGISRLIHRDSSRHDGPFVAFNCTALAETLVEAELFGSTRGAYTGSTRDRRGLFQMAHSGTLMLDEVGDMPSATQAKLLRTLQENRVRPVGGETEVPIDVRIIAATHRDLEHRVAAGRFRRDLFYRLAVVRVEVPPLRERISDLPQLVESLGPRLERETGCGPLRLSGRALAALRTHDWPGNVRELHAVLARALLRANGARIEDFHLGRLASGRSALPEKQDGISTSLERRMIEAALRNADGSIAGAAREIGWTRQKLYRRVKALGLEVSEA